MLNGCADLDAYGSRSFPSGQRENNRGNHGQGFLGPALGEAALQEGLVA